MLDRWIVDNEPSRRYPIYTRANAGEVYPNPVTPLSGSLIFVLGGETGWRDAYLRYCMRPDEFDLSCPEILGCFGGYLYLNMSLTRLFGVRMPGMTPELVDFQYFGEMPGIPPYVEQPGDVDEDRTVALQGWLNDLFGTDDLAELRDRRDEVDRLLAGQPGVATLTDAELVARMRGSVPLFRTLFDEHITISAASGVGVGTVAGVCDQLGELGAVMTLVAGIGDVDSAAPAYALWELSRLDADSDEFRDGFAKFQLEFGSRGPNEWELRSPTWGTKPAIALAAIDCMRPAPDRDSQAHHGAAREADADQEAARIEALLAGNHDALGQFRAGLRAARLYLAGRERTKTTIIKVVHDMRLAALELGRRHCERPELVFMVTERELDEFIAYPGAFGELLGEREREYLRLFDLEPPFIVVGSVPPLGEWRRRGEHDLERAAAGDQLAGIPGCPGVATGRARVVLDPTDPSGLEPGDVLVAPITDPAWTPLFVPAAAVVVDVGAQVSHAVIVSRELGIPCVVSVTDATKRIQDGALIEVDGTAGTVKVL